MRAVDSQPCLRVAGKHNDFEEVGRTPRHHGPLRDAGQLELRRLLQARRHPLGWEFLTGLGLPPDRVAATVYTDDDEAHRVWADEIGLPPRRLVRRGNIAEGDEKELLAHGRHRPVRAVQRAALRPRAGAVRGRARPGPLGRLPALAGGLEPGLHGVRPGGGRHADAAAVQVGRHRHGLERIASVVQGVDSNYRTDLFAPIIERLAEFIGHDPRRSSRSASATRSWPTTRAP